MESKRNVPGRTGHVETFDKVLATIVCPHCWHQFHPRDVLWVAMHEDLRGDPVAGQDEMLRFRPSRFNLKHEAIDARGIPCQTLACPQCHMVIPSVLLEKTPLIFSLVGVRASGKSYLLAAMSRELRRVLPQRFRLHFDDADNITNRVIKEYEERLFQHADPKKFVSIEATQARGSHYKQVRLADVTVWLPNPYLFVLRPTHEHQKANEAEQLTKLLCLYDNAGEHFQPGAEQDLGPGAQHMAHSRVLMFLYDPTQDPYMREACRPLSSDPQLTVRATTQVQATVLNEMALRLRKYRGVPATRKVTQPLLVLISEVKRLGQTHRRGRSEGRSLSGWRRSEESCAS